MDLESLKRTGEELQSIGNKPCTTRDNPPVLKMMFEVAKDKIEQIQPMNNPYLQEVIAGMETAHSMNYPYENTVKIGAAIVGFVKSHTK